MVHQCATYISARRTFHLHYHLLNQLLHDNIPYKMSVLTKEGRIILAIEAIRTTKKMSIQCTAKTYEVPEAIFCHRIKGRVAIFEKRNVYLKLTSSEEDTLVQYILDLDTRGFPSWINGVEDMANSLLATHREKPIGKQ